MKPCCSAETCPRKVYRFFDFAKKNHHYKLDMNMNVRLTRWGVLWHPEPNAAGQRALPPPEPMRSPRCWDPTSADRSGSPPGAAYRVTDVKQVNLEVVLQSR